MIRHLKLMAVSLGLAAAIGLPFLLPTLLRQP